MIFVYYGILLLPAILYTMKLGKQKKLFFVLVNTFFILISVFFFAWFVKVNYFNTTVCDVTQGCMNETGLLFLFSLYAIAIPDLFLLTSLLIYGFYKIRNKR